MKNPKFIAGLVLAILFLIFLFQNTQVVTLRLYFWKISMSQIILIPLVLILGFLIGYIVAKVTKKGPPLKLK
ncbi:MAG: lipopolysaccharide assembly protein LapA domain-containing protein [Pseudomonadota bacterium]